MTNILLASKNWIPFSKPVARALGSLEAAVLLSEICNLISYHSPADGWVFATAADIERETTLSRHRQDAAIKVLEDKGLLLTKLKGMPARRHFRLADDFNERLNNDIRCLPNTDKQVCENSTNKFAKIRQTSLPKNGNDNKNRSIRSDIKTEVVEAATPPTTTGYPFKKTREEVRAQINEYLTAMRADQEYIAMACKVQMLTPSKLAEAFNAFSEYQAMHNERGWPHLSDFKRHFFSYVPTWKERVAKGLASNGVGVIGQRK